MALPFIIRIMISLVSFNQDEWVFRNTLLLWKNALALMITVRRTLVNAHHSFHSIRQKDGPS
jgi:hypothetical protein